MAQTLIPLFEPEEAETVLGEYKAAFTKRFAELMRGKLSLRTEQSDDARLIDELFEILQVSRFDYTTH